MDTMASFVWNLLTTTLSWLWSALQVFFGVPVFGDMLRYAFWAGCIYLLYRVYRMMPAGIRSVAEQRLLPPVKWATDPPRWYLAQIIAPGPFIRAGEAGTKVIEKEVVVEVRVPMRRSFKQWLMSGVRWGIFYLLVYAMYANWSSILPLISQRLQ